MYGYPKLEPNYLVKTELEVEASILPSKEKGDVEEKKSNLLI